MNIAELLTMPKGMSVEEYESLLKKKKRLEKQLAKIQDDIYFAQDALEILRDEVGTERYNKRIKEKEQLEKKLSKKLEEYAIVERKLKGDKECMKL